MCVLPVPLSWLQGCRTEACFVLPSSMLPQSWDNLCMTPGRNIGNRKSNHTRIYHYYSRKWLIWTSILSEHVSYLNTPTISGYFCVKLALNIQNGWYWVSLSLLYQLYGSWKHRRTATSKVGFATKVKDTVNFSRCCAHSGTCYVHSAQKINFRLGSQGKHRTHWWQQQISHSLTHTFVSRGLAGHPQSCFSYHSCIHL